MHGGGQDRWTSQQNVRQETADLMFFLFSFIMTCLNCHSDTSKNITISFSTVMICIKTDKICQLSGNGVKSDHDVE